MTSVAWSGSAGGDELAALGRVPLVQVARLRDRLGLRAGVVRNGRDDRQRQMLSWPGSLSSADTLHSTSDWTKLR